MSVECDDTILYHGSYCEVKLPNLSMCAQHKDFGCGFYLTTSLEQARNFSKISLRKAIANGKILARQKYGVVSAFRISSDKIKTLKVHFFKAADEEWLHCVVGHRKPQGFEALVEKYGVYDVIVGKIANDATNATITAYMVGLFGEVGSERAVMFCISLLQTERLKDQYCFRSEKALSSLKFMKSEKVWL